MNARPLVSFIILLIATVCAFHSIAAAQSVEFNYNGRITAQGQPHTGTGFFKFSIVNKAGDITYWANDGVTLDGSEPTSSVPVQVERGFFSVNIGDTETSGMAPLDASIFNGNERVFLRSWFDDGVAGFEQLHPDRRIVNPALLGQQSLDEINLYVNPDTGNDNFPGLSPGRAKKTIQAAWDILPAIIRKPATIHLADGTYREEVLLSGKSVLGEGIVEIVGNQTTSNSVVLTGANADNPTSAVREHAFHLDGQTGVIIRSMQFEYFPSPPGSAIFLENSARAKVANSKFVDIGRALNLKYSSHVEADNLDISDGLNIASNAIGVWVGRRSTAVIHNSSISNFESAVICKRQSYTEMENCLFDNSSSIAVEGSFNALVHFDLPETTISNCPTGVSVGLNSTASYANGHVNYVNVSTPTAGSGRFFN